jgi:hypothetical protein
VSHRSTTLLLVFTFLLVLGSYWQLWSLRRSFDELRRSIEVLQPVEPIERGTMKHEHVSGGQRRSFTTNRNPGESNEDFGARHVAAVQAFLAEYPPD